MNKIIHVAMCYLAGVLMAGAQVVYSGGTLTQNFDSLSANTVTTTGFPLFVPTDNNIAWTDNSTLTGWYASEADYTTSPSILGLNLTNQLTSSGSGGERALGSYLGVLTLGSTIDYGIRIQNNLGYTMTQFTLTFDTEGYTTGIGSLIAADVLNTFAVSYSTTASDVSGAGATGYQTISSLGGGLATVNLLSQSGDTARLQATVTGLNVAQGSDLWVRWERGSVVSLTNNALSTDNLSFTAVPEPSTYLMLGLGLGALYFLRRNKMSARKAFHQGTTFAILLTGLSLIPSLQAQQAPSTEAPMEETVVRSAAPEKTEAVVPENKANTGSAATHEYKPQWNRMMLAKDFEETYRTELAKGDIAVYEPGQYFRSVRNYQVSTGTNSTPPPVVWLRHESYVLRGSSNENRNASLENNTPLELPIARPNKLMPVLDAKGLFGNTPVSQEDYFNKMYYLRTELMETTKKVNGLLKTWDTGTISKEDMSLLQSASKVDWLVCCSLIAERRDIDDLLNGLYQQTDLRLNPGAMTPSMASTTP